MGACFDNDVDGGLNAYGVLGGRVWVLYDLNARKGKQILDRYKYSVRLSGPTMAARGTSLGTDLG